MATTFLDLPDELILRIAELLFSDDLSNLRFLTKKVDRLISPPLFEILSVSDATRSRIQRCISLSEDINLGKELVFSHCTKKVNIDLYGTDPPEESLPCLRLLESLVPTLTNLQSLRWTYCLPHNHLVSPLIFDVFNSFASIPSLRELILPVIVFTPDPGFTLSSFSNLSSVSITWKHRADVSQDMISDIADLLGRCPNLEQFTFNIPRPYHPSQVPEFTPFFARLPPTACLTLRQLDLTGLRISGDDFRVNLRHLSCLIVLRLMFNRHGDSAEQNDQICRLLLDNSIHLNELTIDTTHPTSVLEYLSSYTGLEHLTFCSRYPGVDTPEGVHRFFSSVLPRHCATLRVLNLGWSVETLWTKAITPDDLAQIEKCQQLIGLTCWLTIPTESTIRTDRLLRVWLDAAMKLPRLEYLVFHHTCQRQPPLHEGHFHYEEDTMHDSEMTDQVQAFTTKRLEKLTAGRVIPFRVFVSPMRLGP